MPNNVDFNELMNSFVSLDTNDKPKEIIACLKENIGLIQNICTRFNIECDIIVNREMVDVDNNPTVDDYYEAIYAYIKSLQDINGKLLLLLSDKLEER